MAAKRFFENSDPEPIHQNHKRMRTRPSFASVIKEVVTVNFLENFSSVLEPMLRRVVYEEVESGLRRRSRTITRSPSFRIQALEPSNLQLIFNNKPSLSIFTNSKISDEYGQPLQILLVETTADGVTIPANLPYPIKIEIVVLDGDFRSGEIEPASWSHEEFNRSIVKERTGKRPLLTGDVNITVRDGGAFIGDLEFTDNSSWIRGRKFRLGAKVVQIGTGQTGFRITEAVTDSFMVKDHRGELYKKHYPPALGDDVWRLKNIGKDGTFHQKMAIHGIKSVQDFLKMANVDPNKLRTILGSGMSEKMWEVTYKHAKTCEMGTKLYIARGPNYTLFLNPICQVVRSVINGQNFHTRDFRGIQRAYIENLVKDAYTKWSSLEEVDELVTTEQALLTQGEVVVDEYQNNYQQQQQQQQHMMLRSFDHWNAANSRDGCEQSAEVYHDYNEWIVNPNHISSMVDNGVRNFLDSCSEGELYY